jgi:hypothetical protein
MAMANGLGGGGLQGNFQVMHWQGLGMTDELY